MSFRRPIETKYDVMERIFDAQAIVDILRDVYLSESGEGIEQATVGRALRETSEVLEEVAALIGSKLEMSA